MQIFENESLLFGPHPWLGTEELPKPSVKLVWAEWRNDQAFITVSDSSNIYILGTRAYNTRYFLET